MNLLTPEPGLLFWMLICFGVVFFALAKFGFPIIVGMVDKRKAFIDESLENAKQANLQLEHIREEGDRILAEARNKQAEILKEANEMRAKIVNGAKESANVEASKIMEEAKAGIQKEKELAMRDVKNQIASLSIEIAEHILRRNLDNKAAQVELVDNLIKEIQQN
jgi:ATP synthase, F0 subunit b